MSADGRHPIRAGLLVAVALGAGCKAQQTVETSASLGQTGQTVAPDLLVEAVGELPGAELKISRGGAELARGPVASRAPIAVSLAGHACEVVPGTPFSYDDTSARLENVHRQKLGGPTIVKHTFTRVPFTVRCADGPVPGTPASMRGANPRRALLLTLPGAVLGAVAGAFARDDRKGGERIGAAVVTCLVAVIVAIGLGVAMFGDLFKVTMTVAAVGVVVLGVVGGKLWQRNNGYVSTAWSVGAVAGALPLALLWPSWTYGGPVVALACAAVAAMIAGFVMLLIKPLA